MLNRTLWEVLRGSASLPMAVVRHSTVQQWLCASEQLSHCFEHGDAHNVVEAQLQEAQVLVTRASRSCDTSFVPLGGQARKGEGGGGGAYVLIHILQHCMAAAELTCERVIPPCMLLSMRGLTGRPIAFS